ncbi:MAG: hypothetical protein IRY99_05495, partial [Isosphaeraceae bacterium]|nr:hypothetical protein [Isosphaeraceae bacterium]
MTILADGSRTARRRKVRRDGGPSVREVCLLGLPAPARSWAAGECIAWGGRAYRISALQAEVGEGVGALRYVHL